MTGKRRIAIGALLLSLCGLGACAKAPAEAGVGAVQLIDGPRAHALVEKEAATLLDVRSDGEWQSFHLDGSKHIPIDQLARRVVEVGPKDKPVVVYCQSGVRSATAAQILQKAGYLQVFDMQSVRRY